MKLSLRFSLTVNCFSGLEKNDHSKQIKNIDLHFAF
jgi:hypothetical protein